MIHEAYTNQIYVYIDKLISVRLHACSVNTGGGLQSDIEFLILLTLQEPIENAVVVNV